MKNDITLAGSSLRIYTNGILRFDMGLHIICRTVKRLNATLRVLASKSWWCPTMAAQIWQMVKNYVHHN